VLLDSSGTQIGALPVSGTGTGALQTIDPGVQTSLGSGWKSPKGIDVDSSGAIYVADSGANAVYRYASVSDVSPNSIGSNLSAPTDVKLDAAGNAYIADSGNGRIVVVPIVNGSLSSSAQSVLYSDISSNTGLALDRNANLYVADSGNARVLEIAAAGGIPNPGYIRTIGSGFTYPVAVSTDSSGNVYVVERRDGSCFGGRRVEYHRDWILQSVGIGRRCFRFGLCRGYEQRPTHQGPF
jgi:serine/threonine-protein kinase